MSGLVEWIIFLALSAVALVTAAGMLLTMSMYRAGLALMSSFVALAGLFILLDADLLAAIQIMMNVGGVLVMILFMVMIMMDPGGEMMWDMKRKMRLPGPGAFSMSMPRRAPTDDRRPRTTDRPEAAEQAQAGDWTCPMHSEIRQDHPGECPICGMDLVPVEEEHGTRSGADGAVTYTCPMHPEVQQQGPGECPICGMDLVPAKETAEHTTQQQGMDGHGEMEMGQDGGGTAGMSMAGMSPRQHYQMMVDMAMSTVQLPWALAIGAASAVLLVVLVIRTAWPLSPVGPTQDATVMVGELLLSRYMIGFEGAAFLILAGIAGAVIFARREAGPPRVSAKAGTEAEIYTCPMHPEVRQEGPGQCPICGMDLVPAEQVETLAAEEQTYTCPMHPEVEQQGPGQCPICGMDLVPTEEVSAPTDHGQHSHGGES